ncbi:MAG: NADH-quinone oxidoreductase subunit NuoE family protein [Bellilinea sp.]
MNQLLANHPDEIRAILAKYPPEFKRSAVMPLLHLAQSEPGYITAQILQDIAEICEISITDVGSIVGFYTLYYDQPLGRYHIQVCTDLPCALRGADKFLKQLCERLGVKVGEPTADGLFVIEEVMCLAACHRAPMFQVHGDGDLVYHENQTIETAMAVFDALRQKAVVKQEGKA